MINKRSKVNFCEVSSKQHGNANDAGAGYSNFPYNDS